MVEIRKFDILFFWNFATKMFPLSNYSTLFNMVEDLPPDQITEEYINDLFNVIPFDMKNVIKLESGNYDFSDQEYSELLDNLNYLGYKYLEDIVLFVNFKNSKYIEDKLKEDLRKIYYSQIEEIDVSMSDETYIFLTFVKRGCVDICVYLYNKGLLFGEKGENEYLNECFVHACISGHLKIAKLLYSNNIDLEFPFIISCALGYMDLVEWIYSKNILDLNKFTNFDKFSAYYSKYNLVGKLPLVKFSGYTQFTIEICNFCFLLSTFVNKINVMSWLYQKTKIRKSLCETLSFYELCSGSELKTLKFIYSLGCVNLSEISAIYGIYSSGHEIFWNLCKRGDLEIIKWYIGISSGLIDVHLREERGFHLACKYGKLEVAKWLYENYPINIYISENECFKTACISGHLDVAKWLHSLGVKMSSYDSLFMQCSSYKLDMLMWLYSISISDTGKKIDIYQKNDFVFQGACQNGCLNETLDVVIWLYSLGGINVEKLSEELFTNALNKNKYHLVKWLYNLPDFDKNVTKPYLNDERFIKAINY